jgi:hypothetical protein
VARRRGSNGGSPFGGGHELIPVPKLTERNSNLRGRSRRKPPGKFATIVAILSIMGLIALGVSGFVTLTEKLPYRAGWSGTPGTLSLVMCRTVGSGKNQHTDCDGEFRANAQTPPVLVSIEGDSTYSMTRTYPARLHSDGQTASVVGGKSVAFILGGMFAVLGFVIGLGLPMLLGAIVTVMRWFGRVWRPGRAATLTSLIVGGVLVLFGLVGGIVGSALSF